MSHHLLAIKISRLTVKSPRSLGLTLRSSFTEGELSIVVTICLLANKTEHSSHNVPHHHLPRLRSDQAPAHTLHPLNELHGLGCTTC